MDVVKGFGERCDSKHILFLPNTFPCSPIKAPMEGNFFERWKILPITYSPFRSIGDSQSSFFNVSSCFLLFIMMHPTWTRSFGILAAMVWCKTCIRTRLVVQAKLGGSLARAKQAKEKQDTPRQLLELQDFGSAPVDRYPLGPCQGDCDVDTQCQEGLICFKRSNGEPVPGCDGLDNAKPETDFCVYDGTIPPQANLPSFSPAGLFQPSGSPLGSQLDSHAITSQAPSKANPVSPISSFPAESFPPLLISKVFPLKLCQGDCDSNDDCQPGLICFQRNGTEPVPGCSGTDSTRTDYCILDPNINKAGTGSDGIITFTTPSPQGMQKPPSNAPASQVAAPTPGVVNRSEPSTSEPAILPAAATASPTVDFHSLGTFRLKLYWEEGYYWQCEHIERKWCMHCRNSKCALGDEIYVSNCSDVSQRFEFVSVTTDNKQVLVKVANQNLCFEKYRNHNFNLQSCNASNLYQQWFAGAGGFDEYRFELTPVWNMTYCATQRHEPKADEHVHLETAEVARMTKTSFWNRF